MKNILELPEEVLVMIFSYFDLETKLSVYDTCQKFNRFVCARSINKHYNLSMSNLPKNTLDRPFMRNISQYIEELDMSCVPHLTKTKFLHNLKRMKNLKTLNVAHTGIIISDLFGCKVNLRNLSINFRFEKRHSLLINPNTISDAQEFFKNFESVNFVGLAETLLFTKLPACVLSKTSENITVKFTLLKYFHHGLYLDLDIAETLKFYHHSVVFPLLEEPMTCPYNYNFDALSLNSLDFILLHHENVYSSERFTNFIEDNFGFNPLTLSNLLSSRKNNDPPRLLLFWDKKKVIYDKIFFDKLIITLKDFFPNYINGALLLSNSVKNKYTNTYIIKPSSSKIIISNFMKKRRIAPKHTVLDYDDMFKEERCSIKINFELYGFEGAIGYFSIPENSDYLKKISFLDIVGDFHSDNDFFVNIFTSCERLVTFSYNNLNRACDYKAVTKHAKLSNRLKNIRLIYHCYIDFAYIFSNLSECKLLENIYLKSKGSSLRINLQEKDVAKLIRGCEKLCSVHIAGTLANKSEIAKMISAQARKQGKKIKVEIAGYIDSNPFLDIFHIIKMRPFMPYLHV